MSKKYLLNFFSFSFISVLLLACSSSVRFAKENTNSTVSFYEEGEASYYAEEFNGRKTASGEIYNMHDLTAAHPKLPFGTKVKVTNLSNNKSIIVRINDRMPDFKGRIIDLSYRAAKEIGMIQQGIQEVSIEILK